MADQAQQRKQPTSRGKRESIKLGESGRNVLRKTAWTSLPLLSALA
jgi:hypothetical protein